MTTTRATRTEAARLADLRTHLAFTHNVAADEPGLTRDGRKRGAADRLAMLTAQHEELHREANR